MDFIQNDVSSNNYIKVDFNLKLLSLYFEEKIWIHANPSLYYNSKILDMYYEENTNSKNFLKQLDSIVSNKEISGGVVIHANRGAGKTFLTNFYLNKNTEKLNSKHITWIRIDITKIYRNYFNGSEKISLENYFYAQLLYVFFRYHDKKNDELNREYKNYDKVFHDIDIQTLIDVTSKKIHDECFKHKITELIKEIKSVPNFLDSLRGKPFDFEYLKRTARTLISILKNKNKSLLLFIDGFDNIDYTIEHIKNIKNDIVLLVEKHNRCFKNIILTIRSEHYRRITDKKKDYWGINSTQYRNINRTIKIQPVEFSSYIERTKQKFVRNVDYDEKRYVELKEKVTTIWSSIQKEETEDKKAFTKNSELRYRLKKEIGEDLISELRKAIIFKNNKLIDEYFAYASNLENYVYQALRQKNVVLEKEDFNLLRDLFNNDFRELINLSIDSFMYIYNYISRNTRFKSNMINNYLEEGTNYLLVMEALFKNGNLFTPCYKDKQFTAPYRNLNFINILNPLFNYTVEYNPIIYVYFLFYLKKKQDKDTIYNYLKKLGVYDSKDREQILEAFLEYNYIENVEANNYTMTRKGNIILDYSFKDIHVLHSYVYNGLWREDYLKHLQKYGGKWEGYLSVLLNNITVIIKYLEDLNAKIGKRENCQYVDFNFHNPYIKKDFISAYSKAQNYSIINAVAFDESTLGLRFKEKFKTLSKSVTSLVDEIRKIEYKNYSEIFSDLTKNERMFLVFWFNELSTNEMAENYYLHKFLFNNETMNDENIKKRKEELSRFKNNMIFYDENTYSKINNIIESRNKPF
jgi:hypothetical protein